MIVLALDTSSPAAAVALANDSEVVDVPLASDRRASEDILTAVAEVVSRAGRRLSDCERIAVCAGPGSFTGMRIGLATAWALSRALGVPIEPVSTLEAMAEACRAGPALDVLAALDAGRGEASVAGYDLRDERAREASPLRRVPHTAVGREAGGARLVALPAGWLAGAEVPDARPARGLALAAARAPRAPSRTLAAIYSRPSAAEEKHGPSPA